MDELAKRRTLQLLGQRAVEYYIDTGLCVFCECDVTKGIPHFGSCAVIHEVSGVKITPEWIAEKIRQRSIVNEMLKDEDYVLSERAFKVELGEDDE